MRSMELLYWIAAAAPIVAALGPELFQRQACNRDNCFRAVLASSAKPGPAAASADCSSFQRTTVTPCPSTFSSTVTSTVASIPAGANSPPTCSPTTNSQTLIPSYASTACNGSPSRYSSACSCDGITPSRTTLPVTPTTITSYVTSSAAVCSDRAGFYDAPRDETGCDATALCSQTFDVATPSSTSKATVEDCMEFLCSFSDTGSGGDFFGNYRVADAMCLYNPNDLTFSGVQAHPAPGYFAVKAVYG